MRFEEVFETLTKMKDEQIPMTGEMVDAFIPYATLRITEDLTGETTAIIHPKGTTIYAKVELEAKEMAYYVKKVDPEPQRDISRREWGTQFDGLY